MKFVSKKLAIKLKEKGFDKPCFGWYYETTPTGLTDGEVVLNRYTYRGGTYEDTLYSNNYIDNLDDDVIVNKIDAPTIEQVLEWLREEKNICVWAKPHHTYVTNNSIGWDWNVSVIDEIAEELITQTSAKMFASYEDACIAGIEYIISLM